MRKETLVLLTPSAPCCLSRLMLGGAICGSFIGSFAGALLGVAIGAVYRDISLGLDSALLGGSVVAAAGAAYGFALGRREHRKTLSAPEETPGA